MADSTRLFSGFPHSAGAETRLGMSGSKLLAEPARQAAVIDVAVETGPVQGIIPDFEFDARSFPDGAKLESVTTGILSGDGPRGPQVTGRLTMRRKGAWVTVTPDFSPLGAATYELVLFREGKVVWRQSGLRGAAGALGDLAARPRRACCRVLFYSVSFFAAVPFAVANGPQIDSDSMFFIPENRTRRARALTSVRLIGTGMERLAISGMSVAAYDPFVMYAGTGDAALAAGPDGLSASVAHSAEGGLSVACGDVDDCAVTLSADTYEDGADLTIRSHGGAPGRFASLRVPVVHGRSIEASLSGISASNTSIDITLPPGSRTTVKAERVRADRGEPGTLREVQATLRDGLSAPEAAAA